MPSYTAPTKDAAFVLHELLKVQDANIPGFDELSADFTSAVLEEASKIATNLLQPLNAVGDHDGCTFENGVVRTPKGFKEAFDEYRAGGWNGLDLDPEYGGQGMPYTLATAVGESFSGANMAFVMYGGLTHGAYSAIHAHGTDAQKTKWLPKMADLEWTGTMNLTESHCGTDLGLMRTKAVPQDDGSYKISGQKIFISAGDHDLSDNVIHLVLAKIPGGPDGIKGVSLFIVPKFMVDDDGNIGERNGVSVGNIEEKMGIHGNATCVMNYDDATGYLLGEENKGMRAMFTMMNEARLGEGANGVQALDLVGRKMAQDGGKHVMAYFDMIKTFISENKDNEELADFLNPLKDASKDLQEVMMYFMQHGMKDPNSALAGSTDALHLFGHVSLGLMWAQMAKAALAGIASGEGDQDFYKNKIVTGKYYMTRVLPAVKMHKARAMAGAESMMALDADHF
ncbi:UNVERIFIED_CONTAM: hypothetical protein GTU68_062439 [Idotea baltica]|nr:hypothetical protein [Idotea baltica]